MHKIVVGVDGSIPSRQAMDWAWDEAVLSKATLHLVHAWSAPFPVDQRVTVSEPVELVKLDAAVLLDGEAAALIDRKRPAVGAASRPPVHAVLREGPPADELVREGEDADLVVVGSRGRGGLLSLILGSVAHEVSDHATCPVVVVPGRAGETDAGRS